MGELSKKHKAMLMDESGISEELLDVIKPETTIDSGRLAALGFSDNQRRIPALMLPLYRAGHPKHPAVFQIRPDNPRTDEKGRLMKYEYPFNNPPVLECAPVEMMDKTLFKSRDEVFITEGAKKAWSAISHGVPCMSLSGVWSWRAKNKYDLRAVLPEIDEIDWKDRVVNLCFDNDIVEKENVYWALVRLSGILSIRGAKVRYVLLPAGQAKGLDDWFVAGGQSHELYRMSTESLPEPPNRKYSGNDLGMAHRVSDATGEFMFWDNHNGLWYVWNGTLWTPDRQGAHARAFIVDHVGVLKEEALGLSEEVIAPSKTSSRAKHFALANRYGDWNSLNGCEKVMRSLLATDKPGINEKPNLLCMPNGTLELDSGVFREHRATDKLTIMANVEYDAEAKCPMWDRFMEDRFPNEETRNYVRRMCGLFLTGNSPEKAFFILQGEQDCGKTVFIEFFHWLLGGYGGKVNKATLTKGKNGDDSKALERAADLVGRRYIYVDESNHKDEVDDAFIKEVTGGQATIKYRLLYEQPQETKAEFTLVLATNFKPRMTGNDEAIWRRCNLVHFGKTIPKEKQIGDFQEVLKPEGPGVLNWAYQGYLDWKENGLKIPPEVVEWTHEYQNENDPVGKFVRECYDIGEDIDQFVSSGVIAEHYKQWALANEINVKSLQDTAQLSRHIKQRWPLTKEGPRRADMRGFYHMKAKTVWRGEEPSEEEVMTI